MHLFSTIQKQSKDTIFSLSLPQTVCALCPVRVSLQQYTSMSSVELHSHTLLNIFFFKLVYSFFFVVVIFPNWCISVVLLYYVYTFLFSEASARRIP